MLLHCGMERTILRGVIPQPQQVYPTFSCLNVHERERRRKNSLRLRLMLSWAGPKIQIHLRFWMPKAW